MSRAVLMFCFMLFSVLLHAQPKKGRYTYKIVFSEHPNSDTTKTCTVKFKGDSVFIIHNGSLTGEKGKVINKGILMKHHPTGKWIIAHDPKDADAPEIGGCSDGPMVMDFKRRMVWFC